MQKSYSNLLLFVPIYIKNLHFQKKTSFYILTVQLRFNDGKKLLSFAKKWPKFLGTFGAIYNMLFIKKEGHFNCSARFTNRCFILRFQRIRKVPVRNQWRLYFEGKDFSLWYHENEKMSVYKPQFLFYTCHSKLIKADQMHLKNSTQR